MAIEVGSLVKVVGHGYYLSGCEGEVIAVDQDTATVRFYEEARNSAWTMIFDMVHGPQSTYEKMEDVPLEFALEKSALKEILRYSYKTIAVRLFGRSMWHSIIVCEKKPGGDRNRCMIHECTEDQYTETVLNFIGTVMFMRTCQQHYNKYHGKCTEDLS